MVKNIILGVVAFALLLGSGTYAYTTLFIATGPKDAAYSQALKDCSSKIPDVATSQGKISVKTDGSNPYTSDLFSSPPDTTNYSLYPAFDRCMANKGFWHE